MRLGVLDRALAVLNACLRLARGRNRRPSAGILDTQSVRTGPQAGPRGYDANKKVKGRKRALLVDTEGLIQALRVVPASVQNRDTPALIEPELEDAALWCQLSGDHHISTDEVIPLAQEGLTHRLGKSVGEAVAEIETGAMAALAETAESFAG